MKPDLFLLRSRAQQDCAAVERETLAALSLGAQSFRQLSQASNYWPSQVAFAIARLLRRRRVEKVSNGHYQRTC